MDVYVSLFLLTVMFEFANGNHIMRMLRIAQDSGVRTQVADCRCPIEVGQVSVEPGDLVFGGLDGVVIVQRHVEAKVINEALRKASGENLVRKEIENGMSSTAAFQKYGIL
jgi:regulator of RNase E activity RraA